MNGPTAQNGAQPKHAKLPPISAVSLQSADLAEKATACVRQWLLVYLLGTEAMTHLAGVLDELGLDLPN